MKDRLIIVCLMAFMLVVGTIFGICVKSTDVARIKKELATTESELYAMTWDRDEWKATAMGTSIDPSDHRARYRKHLADSPKKSDGKVGP